MTNIAVAAPRIAKLPCTAKVRCNAEVAMRAGSMLEAVIVPPSAVTRAAWPR